MAPVQPGTVDDDVGAGSVVVPLAAAVVVVPAFDVGVADGLFEEHPARTTAGTRINGITTHRVALPPPTTFKS